MQKVGRQHGVRGGCGSDVGAQALRKGRQRGVAEDHSLVARRAVRHRRPALRAHGGQQRVLRRWRQEAAQHMQAVDNRMRLSCRLIVALRAEGGTQCRMLRVAHAPSEGRRAS